MAQQQSTILNGPAGEVTMAFKDAKPSSEAVRGTAVSILFYYSYGQSELMELYMNKNIYIVVINNVSDILPLMLILLF